MNNYLNIFCNISSKKVSKMKYEIFFSPNNVLSARDEVCSILNIEEQTDMGNYLGIPLIQDSSRIRNYNFILDKVKKRLSGWKRRYLNMAGRVTLAKYVNNSLLVTR